MQRSNSGSSGGGWGWGAVTKFIEGVGGVASAVGGLITSNPGASSQSASEIASASFTADDEPLTDEDIRKLVEFGLFAGAVIIGLLGLPWIAAGVALDALILRYWEQIWKLLRKIGWRIKRFFSGILAWLEKALADTARFGLEGLTEFSKLKTHTPVGFM